MGLISDFAVSLAKKDVARAAEEAAAKRAAEATVAKRLEARVVRPAEAVGLDPRIEARKNEVAKARRLAVTFAAKDKPKPDSISIFDMEGKPFITSRSDKTAAGDTIVAVNDVPLNEPFELRGGQDYMFNNPGSVWASDKGIISRHVDLANRLRVETGQNPVMLPWAMGPTSSTFSHMPRGLMLQYAAASMTPAEKGRLAAAVRSVLPDFKSVDDADSTALFMNASGKDRGALNSVMDGFRTKGGLGLGEAVLATNDLSQTAVPLTGLRNVGVIDTQYGAVPSDHPSYNTAMPGIGLGRLQEPIGALDLLPELRGDGGAFDFPLGATPKGSKSPLYSLQLQPKGGIITDDILRSLADRYGYAKGGSVKARLACKCSQ